MPLERFAIAVCGQEFCLESNVPGLIQLIREALGHLACPWTSDGCLIRIVRSTGTRVVNAAPPGGWDVLILHKDFRFWRDPQRGIVYGVIEPSSPIASAAFLRQLVLNFLSGTLLPPNICPVHGAAVGWHGKGLLIAAPSGVGKTTFTLALVQRGLCFVSDDRPLALASNKDVNLYGFSRQVKVDPEVCKFFPELERHLRQPYGGKCWLDITSIYPYALLTETPVRGVVFLQRNGTTSGWSPVHPDEAFIRLLGQGFMDYHDQRRGMAYFSIVESLVTTCPCYEFRMTTDVAHSADVFCDGLYHDGDALLRMKSRQRV